MKRIISPNFHKVEPFRFPSDANSSFVYKDDEIEVVQSIRSLKFFYRFYVRARCYVFWTTQADLTYLQRIKSLRRGYVEAMSATLAGLDLPGDVLPLDSR